MNRHPLLRLFAAALACCLALAGPPSAALAANEYRVGDVLLNVASDQALPGAWSWTALNKTLTLTNCSVAGISGKAAIVLPSGSTIWLEGSNTLSSSEEGVLVDDSGTGDLTFHGNGSLTCNSARAAIWCTGALTFDGGTVTANAPGNLGAFCGIRCKTLFVHSGSSVTAYGAVTTNNYSAGISATDSVTIDGGTVVAVGATNSLSSYGIEAENNIVISGGTVTATGGETVGSGVNSIGLSAKVTIAISGGTVTATGLDSTNWSVGILGGAVTLSGDASVTAVRGAAPNGFAVNDPTITLGCAYASQDSSGSYVGYYNAGMYRLYKYVRCTPWLTVSLTPDAAIPEGDSGGDRKVVVGHGTVLDAGDLGALTLDGAALTAGVEYTKANSASVDVTLKRAWLDSLPAGTHTLQVQVASGPFAFQTPTLTLLVSAVGAAAAAPKTGDDSQPWLWAGLAAAALVGAAAALLVARRKRGGTRK